MILTGQDYLKMLPIVTAGSALLYYTIKAIRAGGVGGCGSKCPCVNPDIQKDNPKVVTMTTTKEIGEEKAFCRCWRSKEVWHILHYL